MTKPRPRFNAPPRYLTDEELAHYLGHSAGWLTPARRLQLERNGFPRKDSLFDRTDRLAVDAFCNRRSGLEDDGYDDGFAQRLEAMRSGQSERSASGL